MPLVSVIIINYNTFNVTSNCIQSVIAHTKEVPYEIILVDNASTECDAERFTDLFPQVKLVKSKVNKGFAGGNNLGISVAKGEVVLLLNSDTILQEDSISSSAAVLLSQPGTAVLGCRMVFPNNRIQYTARRFRSVQWEIFDLLKFIPWMMPYRIRKELMLGKYFRHDTDIACDWLNGAFFMFRRSLLSDMPGHKLDERFFMYGEDQLWCLQAIRLGWKNYFFAGTTIVHIQNASTSPGKQMAIRKTMMKNEIEIAKENFGNGLYFQVFKAIYLLKEHIRYIMKWVYFKLTNKVPS